MAGPQQFKRTDWNKVPAAQDDPERCPDGLYSGMAKRVAIEDGQFAQVGNMPKGPTSRTLGERKR